MHTHTHIHANMHTHINTDRHTGRHIHAFIPPTHILAYSDIHTGMPNIHTYTHIGIHTYTQAGILAC